MLTFNQLRELANSIKTLSDDDLCELVGHLSCDYTNTTNATMKRMDICYHYSKDEILAMYPLTTALRDKFK